MAYRDSAGSASGQLRGYRGWFIALGVLLVLLGLIALANLLVATVATVYYVGILMLIGAVGQLVLAFRVKGWGRSILMVLGALLYGIAGIFTIMNPLLASTMLTLLLAAGLIAAGILRIVVAIRERPRQGWGWVLFMGILSIVVALVIISGWPVNSLWILGIFLAADLMGQGLGWLFFGIGLNRA